MTAAAFRALLADPRTASRLDAMLADVARTDAQSMADTTCYVVFDQVRRGRKSIALCGDWVAERDISNDPTCLECRRLLAETAEERFGRPTVGTQVSRPDFDPLAGYRPRTPKPRIRN